MIKPSKLSLANLPTPIMVPEGLSYSRAHTKLYIKRDDFTGFEMSGNKVRKLEYALKQGIESGAEVFITCGGIQSNHARATAAAAARLGKEPIWFLKVSQKIRKGIIFWMYFLEQR